MRLNSRSRDSAGLDRGGLGQPRDPFQQDVAVGQQPDEESLHHVGLSHEHPPHLGARRIEVRCHHPETFFHLLDGQLSFHVVHCRHPVILPRKFCQNPRSWTPTS